jgi:hypothetical protein
MKDHLWDHAGMATIVHSAPHGMTEGRTYWVRNEKGQMFRVDVSVGDSDPELKAVAEESGDEDARRVVNENERLKWVEELCDGREGGSDDRPVWLLVGFNLDWTFEVSDLPEYEVDPYQPELLD